MTHIQAIEENALTYYKGITRLLDGYFTETEEVAWFTTGWRSLYRFNGVVRTAARTENLSRIVEPIRPIPPEYRCTDRQPGRHMPGTP